ncbi:hypothetical protein EVAR_22058_1 [Eumeta japonica]|uniref:RNA-directed DNA polymerase from mobile element jockey n=1 Tax=Eumeta variegata TaxID=151549 RepID=A0A4C1UTY5_EUMVA|nr:hypothetical protein EVAR_22058_1 [Eumeta japonica]
MVTYRLKIQSTPSLTCPHLLEMIVMTLFLQQPDFYYLPEQHEKEEISQVTETQLKKAYNTVENKKVPCLEGIPNVSLSAAIKEAPSLFLAVFNRYLKEGFHTFLMKWKEQNLLLLSKGKKLPDDSLSYRPPCMLGIADEILKHIVHQIIVAAIDLL